MNKIRTLIVDDAAAIRHIVAAVLAEDDDIKVVGTASNGQIALDKLDDLKPDIVILDVEMPNLNGLDTLKIIRKNNPNLPVIMFSAHTESGASITLNALAAGANDYVTKPSGAKSTKEALSQLKSSLIPRLKQLCNKVQTTKQGSSSYKLRRTPKHNKLEIIVIGISTGGPNALLKLIPLFPEHFHIPIVIVQHMPPMFTKLLAERLNQQSHLSVQEATSEQELRPGAVLIAPGNFHLTLKRKETSILTELNQNPPVHSCRPAVDPLFLSAASIFGKHTLGIVMTGMGSDGCNGSQEIIRQGGEIYAQDEASSVVWGMPGAVVKAEFASKILPLNDLAKAVINRANAKGLEQTKLNKYT